LISIIACTCCEKKNKQILNHHYFIVPGLIGLIQSIETIKLIVDWQGCSTLAGRMILLDASDLTLRTVKLRLANENCPACGKSAEKKLPYYSELCGDAVSFE
jgi:hypothetical protein